jgi:hypothetical protein
MKNLLIGMLLITPLVFTSCTKEVINNVDQAFSAVYTIAPGSWVTTDGSLSYSVDLTVPELDNAIIQNGAVDVYLSFDNGLTYETIPEVFGGIAYGSLHQYHIVSIDLHAVDGSTISAPGGTILAKVVLIDATPL